MGGWGWGGWLVGWLAGLLACWLAGRPVLVEGWVDGEIHVQTRIGALNPLWPASTKDKPSGNMAGMTWNFVEVPWRLPDHCRNRLGARRFGYVEHQRTFHANAKAYFADFTKPCICPSKFVDAGRLAAPRDSFHKRSAKAKLDCNPTCLCIEKDHARVGFMLWRWISACRNAIEIDCAIHANSVHASPMA